MKLKATGVHTGDRGRPWKDMGGHGRPGEATGITGGHGRPREAPGGYERPREATGVHLEAWGRPREAMGAGGHRSQFPRTDSGPLTESSPPPMPQ